VPIVFNSGSLNLLELSGPVQACTGINFGDSSVVGKDYLEYQTGCKEDIVKKFIKFSLKRVRFSGLQYMILSQFTVQKTKKITYTFPL
jgi:hypothetical protein